MLISPAQAPAQLPPPMGTLDTMDRLTVLLLATCVVLMGCGGETAETVASPNETAPSSQDAGPPASAPPATPAPNQDDQPSTNCTTSDGTEVNIDTVDGETLAATWYQVNEKPQGTAVLLHMIPPGNTRANYPSEFIDALNQRCLNVLNVDRRGAGGSSGDPVAAYTGPNGVHDAEAAVAFASSRDSEFSGERLVLVGASNGSTTVLDYVAQGNTVAAVALLSPGTYTENQQRVLGSGLESVPTLFAFPDSEADWSLAFESSGGENWVWRQYDGGRHGTGLFASHPESITETADFLAGVLAK